MASILAFTGRLLFALLFVASGVQKLTTYDHAKGGGPVAQLVATKMEVFNKSVHDLSGVKLPFEQVGSFSEDSHAPPRLRYAPWGLRFMSSHPHHTQTSYLKHGYRKSRGMRKSFVEFRPKMTMSSDFARLNHALARV